MASKCEFHLYRSSWASPGCQFKVSEDELIEFDSKHWCPYHLPMKSSKEVVSPKASWDQAQVDKFNRNICREIDACPKDPRVELDLCGVIFPSKVSFKAYDKESPLPGLPAEAVEFAGGADFSGVTFGGKANFKNAKFLASTNFEDAIFTRDANFEDAKFRTINFGSVAFEGAAHFLKASFTGDDSSFYKAEFHGDVVFEKVEFEFEGVADFSYAKFSSKNPINFQQAQFRGNTRFPFAKFEGRAEFHEAIFCWVMDFQKTEFNSASFLNAAFCCKPTNLHKAKFFADVDFSSSKPLVPEDASNKYPMDCFDECDFSGTEFHGRAKFTNRKFLNTTDFSGGFFEKAPEFYGCTLHQGTSFEGRDFRDFVGKDTTFGAAKAYRTLKLAMEAVRDRNEEARFYALEQKSMQETKQGSRSERLFSLMYEFVSDYGRSITRSLVWLVGSYVFFLGFYYFWLFPERPESNILRLSLEPIFQPFKSFSSDGRSSSLGLDLIMALHSLVTLSLVAIFLLALRRRFKLD